MAAISNDENGGKDRATIALVDSKLDSLTNLFKSELGALQRQLDSVSGLPVKVAALEAWARVEIDSLNAAQRAESARLDAIRKVDAAAVAKASEVATTQAQTLATQVATSAETLRTQVAAAASAATIALAAALEPVQKDIADLRRVQYEAQGQKTSVVERQQSSALGLSLVQFALYIPVAVLTLYAAFK